MKSDLDALMLENDLDAILISGPAQHNPSMVYLTGGAHMTGDLIKKRGCEPVLFCNPMEREEAARTGLSTRLYTDYPYADLLQQNGNDPARAQAARYRLMLAEAGVAGGRVALYGRTALGAGFSIFSALQEMMPGLRLVGEVENSILMKSQETKDYQEVERIRRMGLVTTGVVGQVADFLSSHRTRKNILVKKNGEPLTIGDVKARINLWLAERGAENPEGTIFAIGRDAGVPHSTGSPSDPLRLGQTIVFDIFPCEMGGGYYYDFTRTWSLGYATDEVQALYDLVREAYEGVFAEIKVGAPCRDYQLLTCELFEAHGHPTIQTNPRTTSGYVHSLGHGVGLQLHERPWLNSKAGIEEILQPGSVFTVEPGLYYPERGMGVRLEDTAWARPDGKIEILAPYPLDLVLPVKR